LRRLIAYSPLLLLLLVACSGEDPVDEDPPPGDPWMLHRASDYFGLDPVEPEGQELSEDGVQLGRRLFYDTILSDNETIACASCHRQEFAFSDAGNALSVGSQGELGDVNAPGVMNPAWGTSFFWNGRAPSLAHQAVEPVPQPVEMNLSWSEAVTRLQADAEYPSLFEDAFGSPGISMERVTNAIAQFEATLISMDSPWDKSFRGESSLNPDAFAGFALYRDERFGDCFHCHGLGPVFDNSAFPVNGQVFLNNGLDSNPDPGRFVVTGEENDRGRFKVPTLRNVGVTGPYMHDGRFETLEEVVQFYNTGIQTDSPNLNLKLRGNADKRMAGTLPVWTQEQVDQLVAFLEALTDPDFLTREELSDPFAP